MSMLAVSADFNLAEFSTITASPAAVSAFPTGNLVDHRPGRIFQHGSYSANPTITMDFGASPQEVLLFHENFDVFVLNPQTQLVVPGWTVINLSTQDTEVKHQGVSSLRFMDNTGPESEYNRVFSGIVPGATHRILAYILSFVDIYIQDQTSMKWWDGDSWEVAEAPAVEGFGSIGFTGHEIIFPADTGTAIKVRLVRNDAAGAGISSWVDTFSLWGPATAPNLLSIHGHNLPTGQTLIVENSPDNAVWTPRGEISAIRGGFYTKLPNTTNQRYWRVKAINVESPLQPYYGELFLGYYQVLPTPARVQLRRHSPQVRGNIGNFGVYAYDFGPDNNQVLDAAITMPPLDYRNALWLHEQVFWPGRGGRKMVIVPDDTQPEVIYGVVPTDWTEDLMSRFMRGTGTFLVQGLMGPILTDA